MSGIICRSCFRGFRCWPRLDGLTFHRISPVDRSQATRAAFVPGPAFKMHSPSQMTGDDPLPCQESTFPRSAPPEFLAVKVVAEQAGRSEVGDHSLAVCYRRSRAIGVLRLVGSCGS